MEEALASPAVPQEKLLRNRNYLLLLCAKVVSRFGDSVDSIAYSWMVYLLTGSKLLMGTLFAVNCIPSIVLSLFAGVFVDRWPKKLVVIIADYGRGLTVALTATLYALGLLETWHLFVFTIINSSFEAFASPAESAWIPRIIPKTLILKGTSLSSSISKTAELLGLAAAGGIIALIGTSGALWFDAATFLGSAFFLSFVSAGKDNEAAQTAPTEHDPSKTHSALQGYLQELKGGFGYLKNNILILTTVLLAALVNFCLTPLNVLNTIYVKDLLKAGPEILSAIGMSTTLGMILAGLAVSKWGSRARKSTLILGGILTLGIAFAALSLPPQAPGYAGTSLALVFMFVLGVSASVVSAPLSSYIMEVTPGNMLGRVSALTNMLCLSAMPLGGAITGVVADVVPIPILYAVLGIFIALVALALTRFRAFRQV